MEVIIIHVSYMYRLMLRPFTYKKYTIIFNASDVLWFILIWLFLLDKDLYPKFLMWAINQYTFFYLFCFSFLSMDLPVNKMVNTTVILYERYH